MRDLQENIIPAAGQNDDNFYPFEGSGIRVLFAGNSITKHAPKPEVGWTNDCGMAATSIDKDYVHLMVEMIRQYDPNVSYAIAQVADFERQFFTMDPAVDYKRAGEFDADIIIMFFGANVDKAYDVMDNPPVRFGDAYENMRNLLNKSGRAKVFHSEGFYIRPRLNEEKRAAAERLGDTYIELGEIVTREDTHGMFNHPGDVGMQAIAERFWQFVEPEVKRLTGK